MADDRAPGSPPGAGGAAGCPTPWAAPTSCPVERYYRPRVRRPRADAPVAPDLADGLPARGAPRPRRLRRVHDLRPVGPRSSGWTTRTVRAYHNACRHRATELAKGIGHVRRRDRIICPFHGWRWDLEGRNSFVFGAHAFDPALLTPDELCLRQARVDIWGGCVWINLDPDAPPLLGGARPHARPARPARRRRHAGRTGGSRSSCRPTGRWPRRPSWRATTSRHPPPADPRPPRAVRPGQPGLLRPRPRPLQLPAPAQRPGRQGRAGRRGRGRRHHRVGPPA